MYTYTVTGSPVLVRKMPSADAKILNVLPTGSTLYIIAEEEGWLRTSSGYYVFKTDDIERDYSSNAPTYRSLRTQAFRAANPNQPTDASLPQNQSTPANNSNPQVNASANQSGKDTGETAEDKQALRTSDKYQGKAVQTEAQTVQVKDDNGNWQTIQTPPVLTKAGQETPEDALIEHVEQGGYIVVLGADGKEYRVDGRYAKIADKDSSGNFEFTQFELDEKDKEEREANSFIDSLVNTLKEKVDALRSIDSLEIQHIRNVFGMPYQFLPSTDPRPYPDNLNDMFSLHKFGRKYMEKIVARAPVLVMQPGEPIFMRGYSDDIRAKIAQEVVGITDSLGLSDGLEDMLKGNGEYYSFRLKKEDYYNCVNSACRATAILLGLDEVEIPMMPDSEDGTFGEILSEVGEALNRNKLGNFNWMIPGRFVGYYNGCVQFYINSEAQIQENFTTGTRPSQLASKINQISDQAAEAMFVMGGIKADLQYTTGVGDGSDANAATNGITEGAFVKNEGNATGLLHSILGNISTLLAGGKMYFPEIWSDSQFQRSYNVTVKLDSPDCDPFSIYMNILVPLIHLLAFVLPRSAGSNTYISPFLVRCFYKSMFHIDMGIITSCNVVKGDQGAWTQDGLPTQVTVQFSIKDLYGVLTQSRGVGSNTLLSNPAQLDYLANMCGINIAPSDIGRTLKLWWMIKGPNRLFDSVVNAASELITSVYATIYNFTSPTRWMY